MRTLKRICIEDHTLTATNGDTLDLKRGKEYITSPENADGQVTVFSSFWVRVSSSLFAGAQVFTES